MITFELKPFKFLGNLCKSYKVHTLHSDLVFGAVMCCCEYISHKYINVVYISILNITLFSFLHLSFEKINTYFPEEKSYKIFLRII